ncbi:EFR1 family ferrodoxin [Clostridium sp.]|uniref:EFR1 family ferrodoxin n=1 Tax=Clostridium sp. TaxID=1506 RepID=UPI002FCB643C
MIKIYYFTSTGNCLYAGKKFKESIDNVELINISNELDKEEIKCNSDIVGFIFPLHCFGLPIVACEFLKKLKLEGNPYVFFLQVTGGGSSNNSFIQVKDSLNSLGLKLNNYEEIKYISNYTRAGLEPTKERAIKAIEKEESKLNEFIDSVKKQENKEFKKRKQIINNSMYTVWKDRYKKKDKNFNVNEDCIGCNKCRYICPVNNIDIIEKKPVWKGNCTDCMACINICPKVAINIGSKTIKKNRYRNPYIEINELI